MDSIAVVLKEQDASFGEKRLSLSVSLPNAPLHCDAIVPIAAMRYAPRHVYVRDLVRKITRHVEDEILNALKRTGTA